jgi:hypothetical protein
MTYKVTKQFGGGRELPSEQFDLLPKAQSHARSSAAESKRMNVKAIYRIYDFDDLIETIDSDKVQMAQEVDHAADSGGGKQSGSTFKPTPFNTAPRPTGSPQKWLIDPDENKDKK